MQQFTLGELANRVDGRLAGPADLVIRAARILRDAEPGDLTLADRPRLVQQAEHCGASAVITSVSFDPPRLPHIAVSDVGAAFAEIVELYRQPSHERVTGISAAAHVSPTARIEAGVRIGPGASIGEHVEISENVMIHAGVHIMAGCRIGRGTTIFPRVVLYEDTVIGDRVILHAGAVIGAFGFGYSTVEGRHQLSAQLGNVEIEDDVEVGANSTIDRGTYGPTRIGVGTKIDNLSMIGHNCQIGRHNLLCAQVGIAGSSTTGEYVAMAGQVGVRDHVHIGDMAQLGAQAGIASDVTPEAQLMGTPAMPERAFFQSWLSMSKVPTIRRRLRALEQKLERLTASQAAGNDASNADEGEGDPNDSTSTNAA